MFDQNISLTSIEKDLVDFLEKHNLILRLRESVRIYQINATDLQILETPLFLKHNNKFVKTSYPGVIHSAHASAMNDQLLFLLNSIEEFSNIFAYMNNKYSQFSIKFNIASNYINGFIRPALLVSYKNQVFFNSKDAHQYELVKIAEFLAMDNKEQIQDETFLRFAVNNTLSTNKSVFFNFKIKESEFLEDAFIELGRIIWKHNSNIDKITSD